MARAGTGNDATHLAASGEHTYHSYLFYFY